jgi:tetratricopeptide (TPR) repeat protein
MGNTGPRTRRFAIGAVAATVILLGSLAAGLSIHAKRRTAPSDPLDDALAAYRRSDWEGATKLARVVLRARPGEAHAMRLLARASARQGDVARALSIYNSLGDAALEGEDFFVLGLDQHRRGDREDAVGTWRRGVTRDPNHAEMLEALARTQAGLDRFISARMAIRQLMAQPGRQARADLLQGEVFDLLNAPSQAAEALKRGLDAAAGSVDPAEFERARRLLAGCLLRTGRPAEARQALRATPGGDQAPDAETRWLLDRCDLQEGRPRTFGGDAIPAYRDEHPVAPEPAVYLGAARCEKCHPAIFESQRRSRHARTFLRGKDVAELGVLPKGPVPDPGDPSVVHRYQKSADHLEVETRIDDRILRTVVDYAFGSGDRGMTLVGHDDKNHRFEGRLSYYADPGGWDVTSGHSKHPEERASFQGALLDFDLVRRCILCHQTNPTAILTGSGPEAADPAIGCERCHGPGGNHLLAVEANPHPRDLAIARPSMARGEPVVQLCAQCHDPRNLPGGISPMSETSIRFQASSLTWSRCYTESGKVLDCVACHNPHRDVDTNPRRYEAICLECHSGAGHSGAENSLAESAQAPAACPVEPASGCIACHMPKDTSPIPHSRFTDHHIRVRHDLNSGGRATSAKKKS